MIADLLPVRNDSGGVVRNDWFLGLERPLTSVRGVRGAVAARRSDATHSMMSACSLRLDLRPSENSDECAWVEDRKAGRAHALAPLLECGQRGPFSVPQVLQRRRQRGLLPSAGGRAASLRRLSFLLSQPNPWVTDPFVAASLWSEGERRAWGLKVEALPPRPLSRAPGAVAPFASGDSKYPCGT